jgi:hypothetical protein
MKVTLHELRERALRVELVGSRITCSPAPEDTDQDVLVLVAKAQLLDCVFELQDVGFSLDGSRPDDLQKHLESAESFSSFKQGDLNLILTSDERFFRRFMAATSVAKHLNLLEKEDRIALFQAVLYGNDVLVSPDPTDPACGTPFPPR